MLNEGLTDCPSMLTHNPTPTSDPSIQKWVNMMNRCLEQQWKDSQDLLGCAKALMSSDQLNKQNAIVKELRNLGLGMMQRSIHLRQELVDNAYLTELPLVSQNGHYHPSRNPYADFSNNASNSDISSLPRQGNSWLSFSSTPDSDTYESFLSKTSKPNRRSIIPKGNKAMTKYSDKGGYSPFTLHSKLWQQDHQQQTCLPSSSLSSSTVSSSGSNPHPLLISKTTPSPLSLALCDLSLHHANHSTSDCIPACAYNYYPQTSSSSTPKPTSTTAPITQCQQCCFCLSSKSRQETVPTIDSATSSPTDSPFTAAAIHYDGGAVVTKKITSSSSPFLRKIIKSPSILIPTRTSSSPLNATTASHTHSLASHITPSTPSASSSMVHTMSTKFHFKRSETSTGLTSSSSSSLENASSSRFVRSLMARKVSFPTLFTPKKVHPHHSNMDTIETSSSIL